MFGFTVLHGTIFFLSCVFFTSTFSSTHVYVHAKDDMEKEESEDEDGRKMYKKVKKS